MTALLETHQLSAGYNGVPVTRGISLRVNAGEVVALLGPNGAGKTTTLLAISGLLPVLGGSFELLGERINGRKLRPHRLVRRGLVHVPEDRSLFFPLTVRDHLRLCHGADPKAVRDVLEQFPALEALMQRKAGLLSGGEQQMLALARGLLSNPRILIVDELSLGLAPVIVERLLPAVRKLALERGAGVLLVEQHVDLALQTSDRAYVLVNGEIVLDGPAAELRKDRDSLTATYLGDSLRERA